MWLSPPVSINSHSHRTTLTQIILDLQDSWYKKRTHPGLGAKTWLPLWINLFFLIINFGLFISYILLGPQSGYSSNANQYRRKSDYIWLCSSSKRNIVQGLDFLILRWTEQNYCCTDSWAISFVAATPSWVHAFVFGLRRNIPVFYLCLGAWHGVTWWIKDGCLRKSISFK